MAVKLCCTVPFRTRSDPSASIQVSEQRGIPAESTSNPSPAEVPKRTVAFHPTVATTSAEPITLSNQENILVQRRPSSFTSPSLDMLAGRTPLGTWHAVAAKVVATNRFRGVGGESCVEDFKVEELGGQSGKLVFGPVSVFSGNVSLWIKKPLKSMALTVTFNGVAEVDKYLFTFLNISHEVYIGDFQEGLRTFLFGFNFPYLNLPPSSRNPQIVYSFIAKLTDASTGPTDDNSSAKSKISEYKSKPLEIFFIPYIDPSLNSPHVPRIGTSPNQSNGKGKGVEHIKEESVNTALSQTGPGSSATAAKPKLTLTTADLPVSASSNSTPIIDKPRFLDSSITKSSRIMDDDNNTVAKLTVDLPKTKFLPDEEIVLRLRLTVKDGEPIPKGFGVRVIERRFLARIDCDGDNEDGDGEDEGHQRDMKIVGKKQSKVLAGRKFTLRPEEARTVREVVIDTSDSQARSDSRLKGGKVIELPIKVKLPTFQTFINDFLLPTATLPLSPLDIALDSGNSGSIPSPTYTEKGKGKSPALSPITTTPTTTTSISINSVNKNLNFVVDHVLQVTVPTSGSGGWFKKSTPVAKDLEVLVPIVLGNINPVATGRRKVPELRLNALEEIRYGGGAGSVQSSGRSSFGSGSGAGAPSSKPTNWKEGERFLTLKETDVQPFFSSDP